METKYITNKKRGKTSVILSVKKYREMKNKTEEQEDLRLYYEAKSDKTPPRPAEDVFREIEKNRKTNEASGL